MYHTHSHNFTIVALAQFMYYSPDLDGVEDISVRLIQRRKLFHKKNPGDMERSGLVSSI